MNRILCAALLSAVAGHALAINITSAGSGDWNNASTWSPAVVPGPGDIVTIGSGHVVHLASGGVPSTPSITVDRLTVNGTLISDNTPGFGTTANLELNRLRINTGGALVTQSGTGTTPGGSLIVFGRNELRVTVDGSITLGSGTFGGSLQVYGYNTSWTQLPVSVWNSSGTIQAGSEGGSVTMYLRDFAMLGGLIAAGDSPIYCMPGWVHIWADQLLTVGGSSEIRSGDCSTPTSSWFGSVALFSQNQLAIGTNSLVNARTNGCAWIWGGTSTILGTVKAPCLNYDPPNLTLADTGRLIGDKIVVAAQNFTADGLADPGAIDATDTIDFFINPGGTLDLRGLSAGVDWFRAGNGITIRADGSNILTDPGVSVSTLMSPAPIILPAAPLRELLLPDAAGTIFARAGETLQIPRDVYNFGSASELVQFSITDSNGWLLNPVGSTQTIDSGGEVRSTLDIAVPASAMPGDSTDITISVTALNAPTFSREAVFTVRVPASCPADFDESGFVDTNDYDAFVEAFELGSPSADFDASGFTDTDDFDAFVEAYIRGC